MSSQVHTRESENIVEEIENKYKVLGVNQETYLRGLLQLKPLTYWDYIESDTLLSLQKPRTDFKDEEVFIMYHQVTELVLKLILHEIKQVTACASQTQKLVTKFKRLNRYVSILINSFDIMKEGMDYDEYRTFRCALAPASGFQSVQFRQIEIYCTRLRNLVNEDGKKRLPQSPTLSEYFQNLYWRDAGTDHAKKQKTLTLKLFEDKYLKGLLQLAVELNGNTIEERIALGSVPEGELKRSMRDFDRLYNVVWPSVHLQAAAHFLEHRGIRTEATGGSKWKDYLDPQKQRKIFFPALWSEEEITNWGNITLKHNTDEQFSSAV